MKTTNPLLLLIVLAGFEIQAGAPDQTVSTAPTVTPATNISANLNTIPAMTNRPATNPPAVTNGPATRPPPRPSAPTGLRVQIG